MSSENSEKYVLHTCQFPRWIVLMFAFWFADENETNMLGKCVSAQGSHDDVSIVQARNLPQVC